MFLVDPTDMWGSSKVYLKIQRLIMFHHMFAIVWGTVCQFFKRQNVTPRMIITLWFFNIAMENGPFIVDFPIKTSIYGWFSMAMLSNQMVSHCYVIPSKKNKWPIDDVPIDFPWFHHSMDCRLTTTNVVPLATTQNVKWIWVTPKHHKII